MLFDKYYKDLKTRGKYSYRGVVCHKTNKKWLSSISHNKKRISLGYYDDEKDAAQSYDRAIVKYGKPLYKMNFRGDI